MSSKEVEVSKGTDQPKERYSADHILIASGSGSEEGKFEGKELCMTSNDVFDLEELPKSMIVIGGGYIGVEIA